ncbi:MAG: class I SAM-dependent methyltransferase [Burkholderiaceae bacterium]
MNQPKAASALFRWPMPALITWASAWFLYEIMLHGGTSQLPAMLLASLAGIAAGGVAWRRGDSKARMFALLLGFPISLWLSGTASLPTWVWLLTLVLTLLIYPIHAWRDAPVFPTPRQALRDLPHCAPLAPNALLLDAGCGAGDGLLALRVAYPHARWVGIEFSRPLRWLAKLRCLWAKVLHGDIWLDHWGAYDLVYLFQRPETMPRAVAKAQKDMKPGAWLVSLEFEAFALKPDATVYASPDRPVWLYQVPFKPR